VKLSLDLNVGDGYLVGNAVNDLGSYKINIQQGWPDTTLIMPVDLKLDAGTSIIVFDTELGNQIHLKAKLGNQIHLKAKLKNEDTDMIRLFTDLDTLRNLVKKSPIAMDIQQESDVE
jgi:hypothetical protein